MNKILNALINRTPIQLTDENAIEDLHDICECEHAGCNNECPIYNEVLTKEQKNNSDCPYFKSGRKMLEALRNFRGVK